MYVEQLKWDGSCYKKKYRGITVARTGYLGKDSEDRKAQDSTGRIGQLEQNNYNAGKKAYF
jgi:hypothetical protein